MLSSSDIHSFHARGRPPRPRRTTHASAKRYADGRPGFPRIPCSPAADVAPGTELDRVNCHHNFTELESHRGRNMWITRKGAIRARSGDRGVIPGSMGAASFIVSGLGADPSYHSCSHGAGRRLGRKQARRELSTESLDQLMAGRAWNRDAKALLDEHPDAYKDIDEVMEAQKDLVTIEHRLHQILNYKGT